MGGFINVQQAAVSDSAIPCTPLFPPTTKGKRRRYTLDYVIVGATTLHVLADLYALWVAINVGTVGDCLAIRVLSWPLVMLSLLFLITLRRRRRRPPS